MSKKKSKDHHIVSNFVIFLGIIIAITVFFTNLISDRQDERNKTLEREHELESEVNKLEKDNSKLNNKHNALLTDPLQIERFAREQLNFVGPGEKEYEKIDVTIIPNENENKIKARETVANNRLEGAFPWQIPALIILISSAVYYITFLFENRRNNDS